MAIPKLYLEPRAGKDKMFAISLILSFNGQRLHYYTGIRIEAKYFKGDKVGDKVLRICSGIENAVNSKAPSAASYNIKLKNMALDALNFVNCAKGENLTVKYVREQLDLIYKPKQTASLEPLIEKQSDNFIIYFERLIDDSRTGKRVISSGHKKGNRYTHNTIKNYTISLAAVKRFMKHRNIKSLMLKDINADFYDAFRFYCYNVEQKEKSTFGGYIKDIKTVMVESNTVGFDTKVFVMPSYESDTIYLTDAEIEKIATLDLSANLTEPLARNKTVENVAYSTLAKTRDLALIGFYTGLRFSDFSKLEAKNIDRDFIKMKQTKTGKLVVIPIMQKLRPILEKYNGNLPTLSNQRFNDYIKIVARLAGLTENRAVRVTKGNIENEEIKPLFELVSSHVCRRSYATNLFNAGYSPMLIMSSTGHKTESSFLKYIRATNEDKAYLLAKEFAAKGL